MSSSNESLQQAMSSATRLGVFAIVTTALLALTYLGTQKRIEQQETHALLRLLNSIVPTSLYDNDLAGSAFEVPAIEALGLTKPALAYVAYMGRKPVAWVLPVTTQRAYAGTIDLLVGIRDNGNISAVRVLRHRETPGLGDAIEKTKSDWIDVFDKRSLTNPGFDQWAVQKDGGEFDQLTGATITPRAVVNGVRDALRYFENSKSELQALAANQKLDPAATAENGGNSE